MIKRCEFHQLYNEEYICIEKTKLKKEGNKFSCVKCLNLQNSKDYLKNIEELQIEAKENVVKYVEMQNKIIISNNQIKEKYLQSLIELYNKIHQYFENLQKSITSLIEYQNQILSQNINQANSLLNKQSVLDSQSLDNFIIFAQLNQGTQGIIENNYNYINECLQRQFTYEITEIQFRVNQFTTMEIKFDNIPKYEVEQFNIQTEEEDQLVICQDCLALKEYICTHDNCLQEQKQEYLCSCVKNNHDQHQNSFMKTVKKIKNEQTEKLNMIETNYKILKSDVQKRIDKELTEQQQKQQEIFKNNQIIRENLKLLEAQTIVNPFNQNQKYIYHNIDLNLLSYNAENIEIEFKSKINQLEQQLQQNIITMKREEFREICQTREEQQLTQKTQIFQLMKLVQEQKSEISDLQKKVQDTSNELKITEIQNSLQILMEIYPTLKQQITDITTSNQKGIDEIKLQIEKVPTIDFEEEKFSSLQLDLQSSIIIVNEIKQSSQLIPTLKQQIIDITNSIQKGIGEIQSQIQKVPTIDFEKEKFSSLQQDLQKGIGEIQSQIQKVPTIDFEKEKFSSLQQELQTSLKILNEIKPQSLPKPTNHSQHMIEKPRPYYQQLNPKNDDVTQAKDISQNYAQKEQPWN